MVSADKDFLDKGSSKNVLAKALVEESKGAVTLYTTLEDTLRTIIGSQVPPVDFDAIADKIRVKVLPVAIEYTQRKHFTLGQLVDPHVELYATENLNDTAVVFAMDFSVFDLDLCDGSHADEAILILSGQCMIRDECVADFTMKHIQLFGLDRKQLPGGVYWISGVSSTGVRQLPYRVRSPVKQYFT